MSIAVQKWNVGQGAADRTLGAPPELDPVADSEALARGASAVWGIGHPILDVCICSDISHAES